MGENMENLNETYFLNSYLSTKSASIDNFVSAPLVEKVMQQMYWQQNYDTRCIISSHMIYLHDDSLTPMLCWMLYSHEQSRRKNHVLYFSMKLKAIPNDTTVLHMKDY